MGKKFLTTQFHTAVFPDYKPASMKYLFYCLIILSAFAQSAAAQVMIAPTMIYMDVREPFETFTVINQSDAPQEVSLEFEFGYPTSDEAGNRVFEFGDSIAAESYSLNEWIRAFPRQFILEPGNRQVVRLMVRAPSTLPEAVYWTRLATRSMDHTTVDKSGSGLGESKSCASSADSRPLSKRKSLSHRHPDGPACRRRRRARAHLRRP